MMKINLHCSWAKGPGSQDPGSYTTSLAFRKTNPTAQSLLMPETIITLQPDGFEDPGESLGSFRILGALWFFRLGQSPEHLC